MSQTQAVPPAVSEVRTSLAYVLASEPDDLDVRLVVSKALSELEDVHPPYPPLEYESSLSVDIPSEIKHAYRHLRKATDTGESVAQVMACSNAARTLRPFIESTSQA